MATEKVNSVGHLEYWAAHAFRQWALWLVLALANEKIRRLIGAGAPAQIWAGRTNNVRLNNH